MGVMLFGKGVRVMILERVTLSEQMGRKIGYARTSTTHQQQGLDAQVQELKEAGCEEVFSEKVSSTTTLDQRHQLRACLSVLRKGSSLCCEVGSSWKKPGRGDQPTERPPTAGDPCEDPGLIDTQALGKMAPLVVGLLTGLSEVERSLIQEKSREPVEHRRRTGGDLGSRPKTSPKKESLVLRLREEGESYRSIKEQTGLALATITRIVKEAEAVA